MMTPRERVEAVLLRRGADRVPFTVYECMIPQCTAERRLRNEGLCILYRVSVVRTEMPGVTWSTHHYTEQGVAKIRTDYHTPAGDLYTVDRVVELDAPSGTSHWHEERLFKGPEDYRAIEALIRSRVHMPHYGPCLERRRLGGDDLVLRAGVGYEPLQEIIIRIMGVEAFSAEWAERRDEVLRLHDALVEDRRKIYPIVAQAPVLHANYGGNVHPQVVGAQRFAEYIVPQYQEFAEEMHRHGKLAGSHLDADCRLLAPLVARSGLDYIEAFTPAPDSDMTVREALDAWPDKLLWINFPSSVHLRSAEEIERVTLEILRQSAPGDRLLVGITEDVPNDRWQESYTVINRVLSEQGRLPVRAM